MKDFAEDRRKYPRFELNVDAKYRIIDSGDMFKRAKTRNISAEGICFESMEELKAGVFVELEVDLKDNNPAVALTGEVRWSALNSKNKKYINGVRLIDIPASDEGRFLKYYCDKMVEKLSGYLKM